MSPLLDLCTSVTQEAGGASQKRKFKLPVFKLVLKEALAEALFRSKDMDHPSLSFCLPGRKN